MKKRKRRKKGKGKKRKEKEAILCLEEVFVWSDLLLKISIHLSWRKAFAGGLKGNSIGILSSCIYYPFELCAFF